MAEELGRIEKPAAEKFEKGRKLYFVPLIYRGQEAPEEYLGKFNRFWNQVEDQISSLELKLGKVNRLYHELVPTAGEEGIKTVKEVNTKSYDVLSNRLDKGAELEAAEDENLLTEIMDWGRCLSVGLQNQKVFTTVYESYVAVLKQRNEFIARRIDETLKPDEIGILFMREGHEVQFPDDVQMFYIAPPALDEIGRWLREQENKKPAADKPEEKPADDEGTKPAEG